MFSYRICLYTNKGFQKICDFKLKRQPGCMFRQKPTQMQPQMSHFRWFEGLLVAITGGRGRGGAMFNNACLIMPATSHPVIENL